VEQCDRCGHQVISYNSCRNRHCPKCQSLAQVEWLRARQAELLPVTHFHVVFTLPERLAPLALQNPRPLYHLLFQTASQTPLRIAVDPKPLGARIGFLAILHTWGQNLFPPQFRAPTLSAPPPLRIGHGEASFPPSSGHPNRIQSP
jgi:hypothetical protein